jgi:hypothetical protein
MDLSGCRQSADTKTAMTPMVAARRSHYLFTNANAPESGKVGVMNRQRVLAASILGAAALAMFGCGGRTVVHEQPIIVKEAVQQPIIVRTEAMPPMRVESPGPAPRTGDTWVAGHWEKADGGWSWQAGHWEERH